MENGDDTITVTMTEEGYLSMSKLELMKLGVM